MLYSLFYSEMFRQLPEDDSFIQEIACTLLPVCPTGSFVNFGRRHAYLGYHFSAPLRHTSDSLAAGQSWSCSPGDKDCSLLKKQKARKEPEEGWVGSGVPEGLTDTQQHKVQLLHTAGTGRISQQESSGWRAASLQHCHPPAQGENSLFLAQKRLWAQCPTEFITLPCHWQKESWEETWIWNFPSASRILEVSS